MNPILLSTPFASSGDKNTIPESDAPQPQNATWEKGFPPLTQTPISEGGVPPERNDFNGTLNAITQNIVFQTQGGRYKFDPTYANKIGGYPVNAVLQLENGTEVINKTPNNVTNPNVDMTGWAEVGGGIKVVESIADMLAIKNPKDGDVVFCTSYHIGLNKGGGVFKFNKDRVADNDGGTIFNGWVRQHTEPGDFYLSWFGAKLDNVTDDTSVFQSLANLIGAQDTIVVDGDTLISTVDFGEKNISLRGVSTSNSAEYVKNTINISGVGFTTSGLSAKLDSLILVSTGDKNDANNISMLTSSRVDGFWISITSCRAGGFSGHVIKAYDIIDSKISSFVPIDNNLVFGFYINQWVNSTTITLEKVYAQRNKQVFDADNCTQCSMIDCIFEFNDSLGHTNNSIWYISNLYTEHNSSPLIATNTRLLIDYHFKYTANDEIIVTQPDLAYIDKGTCELSPRTANVFELQKSYERFRGVSAPFTPAPSWTKLGTAAIGEAGTLCLEILGSKNYGGGNPSPDYSIAKTTILAQAKNNNSAYSANIQATWHTTGVDSPINEVRFVQTGANRFIYDVFVLQNPEAYFGCSASISRGDAFVWDIKTNTEKPTGGGSGDVNTPTMLIAFPSLKIGAGTGFIGSDGTNPSLNGIATTSATGGSSTALPSAPSGYISVNINGAVRKIPYYD